MYLLLTVGGDLMADDLSNRRPEDSSRISMEEEWEVRYWTRELGVSREELGRLVKKYGHSAVKVRQHLGRAA